MANSSSSARGLNTMHMVRKYNKPQTEVASIALLSMLLAGSVTPTPPEPYIPSKPNIDSNDQW